VNSAFPRISCYVIMDQTNHFDEKSELRWIFRWIYLGICHLEREAFETLQDSYVKCAYGDRVVGDGKRGEEG